MTKNRARSTLPILAAVTGLTVVVIAVLMHTMVVGGRITRLWTPQVEAMTRLQLLATTAHLSIEKNLAGDRTVDMDAVWMTLDEARRLGAVLIGEQETDDGMVKPLTDEDAVTAARTTVQSLDEFRVLSEARVAAQGGARAESRIDDECDELFVRFNRAAGEARSLLRDRYAADLRRFRLVQKGLIVFSVLLACTAAVGFLRLQRRTDRALEEARRWSDELEQIYNTTPVAVALLDRDLRFLRVNVELASRNGLTPAEIQGMTLGELLPTAPDSFIELHREVLRTGEPVVSHEAQVLFPTIPDGPSSILVNITPAQVTGIDGPCLVITSQDVTPLRAAESALQESVTRFEHFMQRLPACAFMKDHDLTTLWVNDEMKRVYGDREWIGRTAGELFPGETGRLMEESDRRALEEGGISIQNTATTASGERTFRTIKFPIPRSSGGPFLGGISVDITHMQEMEAALRESEEKLRTIIENSTNLFYSHTPDHVLTYVSPQVREILDAEPEEALVRWMDFATDNPINNEAIAVTQRAIDTGERQPTYELELRSTTGRRVWVEAREAPVVVDGKVKAIVGALADITERKELSEQLLQSQKLEAVGRLAGGVAHDFNNILQAMFSQLALLRNRLPAESEARPLIMGLQASADRASELTKQLLAFSRRQVLQMEAVDLGTLLGGTLEMLQRMVGEEVEIRFTAPADLWKVQADPGQLQQVLSNLVVNARDAMGARGQIFIRAENRPESGDDGGDGVAFHVADDGVGMDEETKEHIFEPFFTTKEQGKGTGLGLSTVYGIVEQHRGRVEVESEVLRGTTFQVWLPRLDSESTEDAGPEASSEIPPSGNELILLAEDEDDVRSLTCEVLEEAGYRVVPAADGVEAIRRFDVDPEAVDLAVLDVVMPRVGGSEVARHFRARRPDLPILFTSGYSEEFIEGRHAVDGDYELIQKPYRLHVLLTTVHRLLDDHR